MNCVFCELLVAGEEPFGQSENFVLRLDIHPVSPGHLLIIPRRHVTSPTELSVPEWCELKRHVNQSECDLSWLPKEEWQAIYHELREQKITPNSPWFIDQVLAHPRLGDLPEGFNHVINIGEAAGQTVPHFHWHVIPRYKGDVQDPSGGGRYVIPSMGNYNTPR